MQLGSATDGPPVKSRIPVAGVTVSVRVYPVAVLLRATRLEEVELGKVIRPVARAFPFCLGTAGQGPAIHWLADGVRRGEGRRGVVP